MFILVVPAYGNTELEGVLEGAPYRIVVPTNWNGTLLIYSRGTGSSFLPNGKVGISPLTNVVGVDPAISNQDAAILEEQLLADGYALAASAYSDQGLWVVDAGLYDTKKLAQHFKEIVANPRRTIIWSRSQGTLISLKTSEQPFGGGFDGTIAGCAVGAGAPRVWDLGLDIALAYETAFGWPATWGSARDVREGVKFNSDVLPILIQQVTDFANVGRFEFVRLVNQLPLNGFYPGATGGGFGGFNWLFSDMFFITEVRSEVERLARGVPVQNLDHNYTLSATERAYLASLGVPVDTWLQQMNSRRIAADSQARPYLDRFSDFDGDIRTPVLTMHTTGDGLVLPSNESAYGKTVADAGRSDNLLQVYTNGWGHCTFTPAQWFTAVRAMSAWIDSGVRPGLTTFPASLGFDTGYVPGSLPQPPAQ
jgi:hypothetical protein